MNGSSSSRASLTRISTCPVSTPRKVTTTGAANSPWMDCLAFNRHVSADWGPPSRVGAFSAIVLAMICDRDSSGEPRACKISACQVHNIRKASQAGQHTQMHGLPFDTQDKSKAAGQNNLAIHALWRQYARLDDLKGSFGVISVHLDQNCGAHVRCRPILDMMHVSP